MRAVSFVERIEFSFPGNVCENAIVLGDVDNDGNNELVVGNVLGEMAVFKGTKGPAWACAHNLGTVTCLLIGDIMNEEKNNLVSISGEGKCHVFRITSDSESGKWTTSKELESCHTQRLPANTKVALLADIDGDGAIELILGLTDRVVRTYRWANIQGLQKSGKLVGLHKWEFADQVGGISLNPEPQGNTSILVAQPGGTYVRLQCSGLDYEINSEHDVSSTVVSKLTPEYHSLASSRMRNPDISSEILGGIRGTRNGQSTSSLLAVATLDGTLMLVDKDSILWSVQVDHQLFSLSKMDLLGDEQDLVIACAWDGQTYIFDQERKSVRFQFEEYVCAFTTGHYSIENDKKCSCFVYFTFNNKLYLYYNIELSTMRTRSFTELMDTPSIFSRLSLDDNASDSSRVEQEFYEWYLYGMPSLLSEEVQQSAERLDNKVPISGSSDIHETDPAEI